MTTLAAAKSSSGLEYHIADGGLELVAAARDTPSAAKWIKLYDGLEEYHAFRATLAEGPKVAAETSTQAATQAAIPAFQAAGGKRALGIVAVTLATRKSLPTPVRKWAC
eukprot:SAG31_NODE_48_length_30945_cov_16.254263_32_plen_109_part_00